MVDQHPRAALRAARRFLTAAALAAVIGILVAAPVAAHGELVFQMGAERIQPGGTVEVRGDLGVGSTIDIVLISKADGSRQLIASLTDVDEGHFQGYVTIPADMAAGDYMVEAGTESIAVRSSLTIAGPPVAQGGERPEQGEPLIVPLPSSFAGYAFPTAPGVRTGPVAGEVGSWPVSPLLIATGLVLAALVLLASLRLASKNRSGAG